MKVATLKDAQECLEELVGLAQQGETVIIRQRGKPAVKLSPLSDEAKLELTAEELEKLDAWADKERGAGHTRVFESPAAYVASRRRQRASRRRQ